MNRNDDLDETVSCDDCGYGLLSEYFTDDDGNRLCELCDNDGEPMYLRYGLCGKPTRHELAKETGVCDRCFDEDDDSSE